MIGSETIVAKTILCASLLALLALMCSPRLAYAKSGLRLEEVGTERVYFTHNGQPLLSFGGQGDFMFYLAEESSSTEYYHELIEFIKADEGT